MANRQQLVVDALLEAVSQLRENPLPRQDPAQREPGGSISDTGVGPSRLMQSGHNRDNCADYSSDSASHATDSSRSRTLHSINQSESQLASGRIDSPLRFLQQRNSMVSIRLKSIIVMINRQ